MRLHAPLDRIRRPHAVPRFCHRYNFPILRPCGPVAWNGVGSPSFAEGARVTGGFDLHRSPRATAARSMPNFEGHRTLSHGSLPGGRHGPHALSRMQRRHSRQGPRLRALRSPPDPDARSSHGRGSDPPRGRPGSGGPHRAGFRRSPGLRGLPHALTGNPLGRSLDSLGRRAGGRTRPHPGISSGAEGPPVRRLPHPSSWLTLVTPVNATI